MDNPKTDKTVNNLTTKLTKDIKQNLSDENASGRLQKSIKVSQVETKTGYQVILQMEDYGTYVDEGRKPGKGAPINDLKKWIAQKGLTLNSKTKSKQTTEQKINSLAFLINRKIKKKGIEAKDFLKDALNLNTPKFADDLAESIADDLLDGFLTGD